MKKLTTLIAFITLFAINPTQAEEGWWESKPDPSTAVLPMPITQTEVDWFANVADSSGYSDRLYTVEGIAKAANVAAATAMTKVDSAQATADDAMEAASTAHTRADEAYGKASSRPAIDFAGKTFARVAREYAMDYVRVLAMDSTSSPAVKDIGTKLAAKKSLSSKEEELVAKLYLGYLQSGILAQMQSTSQLENMVNARLADVENKLRVLADSDSTLFDHDETLAQNIRRVAHNTATALGADNAEGYTPTKADRQESKAWLANY